MKRTEITLTAQEQKMVHEGLKIVEDFMLNVNQHSSSTFEQFTVTDREIREALHIMRVLRLQLYTAGKITFEEEEA